MGLVREVLMMAATVLAAKTCPLVLLLFLFDIINNISWLTYTALIKINLNCNENSFIFCEVFKIISVLFHVEQFKGVFVASVFSVVVWDCFGRVIENLIEDADLGEIG